MKTILALLAVSGTVAVAAMQTTAPAGSIGLHTLSTDASRFDDSNGRMHTTSLVLTRRERVRFMAMLGVCCALASVGTASGRTRPLPERTPAEAPLGSAADPQAVASKPPAFTFKVGGHFKPQMNFDFSPAGNTDFWDPRTIPVDGSTGQNFRMHARDTRLSLEVRGPVQTHELQMFVETDFVEGTGYALRPRHAYVAWGLAEAQSRFVWRQLPREGAER